MRLLSSRCAQCQQAILGIGKRYSSDVTVSGRKAAVPSKWARPASMAPVTPPRPPRNFNNAEGSYPRGSNREARPLPRRELPRAMQGQPRSPDYRPQPVRQVLPRRTPETYEQRPQKPRRAQGDVNQDSRPNRLSVESQKPKLAKPTRFPMQAATPTLSRNPEEQKKWELKRSMDRERHARKVLSQQAPIPTESFSRKRPRSAHLQQVKSQLYLPPSISVTNFSKLLNVRLVELQAKMEEAGFVHTAPDYTLTADDASLIAGEFNFEAVVDDTNAFDLYARQVPSDTSSLPLRAPLVTIMGHVDHGKTTLLDTLRKSSVAAKEAGGITQHIGAFSVALTGGDKQITFLDTPGHAAFESMRQRGASVTDIVVLVVAADDSVMPQTKEAIKHAHSASVAMIVAVNKMDKTGANADKVKRDLLSHGVEVEDFGGEVQAVAVSGLTGEGLDDLETAILSQAEIMDIRADLCGAPEGWVIESSVKRGRGAVASLIVRCGTLKTGSIVVAGSTWCRVRAMSDEAGKLLNEALPGTPVEVTGWSTLPAAGDEVLGASSEKEAKQVVANRVLRQEQLQQLKDIEAINEKRLKEREEALRLAQAESADDEPTTASNEQAASSKKTRVEVPFIIKADVSGSVEAIYDSIAFLGNDEVATKIVDKQVGEVSESDVLRAVASEGKIVAFNVAVDKKTEALAARQGVEILKERVIYRLIDAVRDRLAEHLKPIEEQRVLGEAEVLKLFQITTKGRETTTVAGCRITNGTLDKARKFRILRSKKTVWEGQLKMLKHVKQEVATLGKGNECGLQFEGFEALESGDAIQCYSIEFIKRAL